VTDGGKRSKAGRFKLVKTPTGYATVPPTADGADELVPVFRDGELLRRWTFDEVRERGEVGV
jgi:nicotinamide phosphoribosyltransferase